MGDCRVRIHACASLIEKRPTTVDHASTERLLVITNDVWSADSTVFDVLRQTKISLQIEEDVLTKGNSVQTKGSSDTSYQTLQSLIKYRRAVVWDCTKLPVADVTTLCSLDVAQSTTLFAAGWFPSGFLQVLPEGSKSPRSAKVNAYDDDTRTYHSQSLQTTASDTSTKAMVQISLAGASLDIRPQPSQVLNEVTRRFGDTSHVNEEQAQAQARLHRHLNARRKAETEVSRQRKLDERINRLFAANGEKNKAVSDQVRRMLVRSRATGRLDLLEQDRIYLNCLLERSTDQSATPACSVPVYRFFSLQDTVGRAVSTFLDTKIQVGEKVEAEMLVHFTLENSTPDVYRLPSTLRFYEAISHSYLTGTLDTVIIRFFHPDRDNATPVIAPRIAQETHNETCNADVVSSNATAQAEIRSPPKGCLYISEATPPLKPSQRYAHVLDALRGLKGSKTKKPTAASEKVRQMQIKSKATGDAKRIKMQDRCFLELVTIIDKSHDTSIDRTTSPCTVLSVSPIFVAFSDKVDRCVRDAVKWPTPATTNGTGKSIWSWELLCTTSKEPYSEDSDTARVLERLVGCDEVPAVSPLTWNEAIQGATVSPFDLVVLRYFVDSV